MNAALVSAGVAVLIASIWFAVRSMIETRRKYYQNYLKRTGRDK
jgi:hypothetical protein